MPRVLSLDPAENRMRKIVAFIRTQMREQKISQEEMGRELNMKQPVFSRKLAKGYFTVKELLRIFYKLHATKEQIGELMS